MLRKAVMQGIQCGPPTLLPLVLAFAACAAPRTNPQAAQLYKGDYTIDGSVAGTPVNGTLSFDAQKYYFESNHGSCSGDWPRYYPTGKFVNFVCGPLNLRFSHQAGQFTDRALATVTRTEQVGTRKECVAWNTDSQRRRICISYMDVPVEKKTRKEAYVAVAPTQ